MNVRKRSGLMKGAGGSAPKNAVSSMTSSVTQAKAIPNTSSQPAAKPQAPAKIRNAVS